jgi:Ca-activated chloride channel family protein
VSLDQQTFRAQTQVVPVYATVRDAEGRVVKGLTRDDFQVFDDGRRAAITVFSDEPQPLSIAVMLDTSVSVRGTGRGDADAVLAFMRALGPNDRASLGTFGAEVVVGPVFTRDISEFARVLREEVWVGGGTPLWQAISEAMTSLDEQPGRHVVVLYSDGVDSGAMPNWRGNRSTVERQAAESNAMVYFVRPTLATTRPLTEDAIALAESTGGWYAQVQAGADLQAAFQEVIEDLRQQYLLGFAPTALDGKLHKVEVRTARPGLKVRARKTYVAGGAR